MGHHHLAAGVETCHWGIFDASLPPVVAVQPGETVTIRTVSGGPAVMPPGRPVRPDLAAIHKAYPKPPIGHILTGPVAIEGAEPGDVLAVHIEAVELADDWGWQIIRPLVGALPEDFPEPHLVHLPLDRETMTSRMPWGVDLPLRPFFGVMGTAPPPVWGAVSSLVPRAMGGNLDNKELGAGATLYLPVFVAGANFSCGDGHAVQGDGEVCVTAIETALDGTFRFELLKGAGLDFPRAETPTHYITMGLDSDLDDAAKQALRGMIKLIQERANLSAEQAYMLCSLAADLRITQLVNQEKGVHVMLAKTALHGG